MNKHSTKFINSGSSVYSFSRSSPKFRLRIPAYSQVESAIPENIYLEIMEDIAQAKYSHIQVIEPEKEVPAAVETVESQTVKTAEVPVLAAEPPAAVPVKKSRKKPARSRNEQSKT